VPENNDPLSSGDQSHSLMTTTTTTTTTTNVTMFKLSTSHLMADVQEMFYASHS
jgi:hypothetical protein